MDNVKCHMVFDDLSHMIKCLTAGHLKSPLRVGARHWIPIVGNIVLFFLVLCYLSRPQSSSECQSSSHVFSFNSCDVGRTSFSKWNHQRIHHFLWNKQELPARRANSHGEHNGTCSGWFGQVHHLLHQSQGENLKDGECFQNTECNNF